MQDRGFTLLQGPPGTGKTHTILGVLSAFVNSEPLSGDRPYILVCAPSNAAIDELATRVLRIGLIDTYGNPRKNLRLVRIGSRSQNATALRARKDAREADYLKKAISADLNSIYLASLVQEILDKDTQIHSDAELRSTEVRLAAITKALDNAKATQAPQQKIQELDALRLDINTKRNLALGAADSQRIKRFKLERDIINNADIIFTTCSMSGGREFDKINHAFDYVIIDEACQSIELAALIPLQYNAKKVVLVGDPM